MTRPVSEFIRRGRQALAAAGLDTPRLDAEILLRHLLRLDRAQLFARLTDPVPEHIAAEFDALIARRAAGMPIAYLTGSREFFGLDLATWPGVLIPRPETELLVEWAIAWLRSRPGTIMVDVGTGTGAIPLAISTTLGTEWDGVIVASDRYPTPISLAAHNRTRLGLDGRVHLIQGNLLEWCGAPVDLITANLPYLRPEQVAGNPMLAAEPAAALVSGVDGLDLIRALIQDAPRVLQPDGAIILEIDPDQAAPVRNLLQTALPTAVVAVMPDLAGLARFVTANLRK